MHFCLLVSGFLSLPVWPCWTLSIPTFACLTILVLCLYWPGLSDPAWTLPVLILACLTSLFCLLLSSTCSELREPFVTVWWPPLWMDIKDFVVACTSCASSKSLQLWPCGLLQPLPNPNHPWTHLAMDFIVELPSSKGNMVIWVVINHFIKRAHFIPLRKCPSASGTLPTFYPVHIPSTWISSGDSFEQSFPVCVQILSFPM